MANAHLVELDRLNFILKREGVQAAFDFAERNMKVYRATFLHGFNKSGKVSEIFRRPFIESYLSFKYFYFFHREKYGRS